LKSNTTDYTQSATPSFKPSPICPIAQRVTSGCHAFTNAKATGRSATHGRVWDYARTDRLITKDVEFNDYCLEFEVAVSAWWIGRRDESIEIFTKLLTKDLTPEYRTAIEGNLARIQ